METCLWLVPDGGPATDGAGLGRYLVDQGIQAFERRYGQPPAVVLCNPRDVAGVREVIESRLWPAVAVQVPERGVVQAGTVWIAEPEPAG